MKVKTKKKLRLLSKWRRLMELDPGFWGRYNVNPDNPGPVYKYNF